MLPPFCVLEGHRCYRIIPGTDADDPLPNFAEQRMARQPKLRSSEGWSEREDYQALSVAVNRGLPVSKIRL
jgi:hypothetical protein